jgi:hypothetical protein
VNVGRLDPAYLRVVLPERLLQLRYSLFYGLGYFDADEGADREGSSAIGLFGWIAAH